VLVEIKYLRKGHPELVGKFVNQTNEEHGAIVPTDYFEVSFRQLRFGRTPPEVRISVSRWKVDISGFEPIRRKALKTAQSNWISFEEMISTVLVPPTEPPWKRNVGLVEVKRHNPHPR